MTTITLTETSKALFIAYAKDAGNWNGTPLIGGNVGGDVRKTRGNLTQLKQAGLIETFKDEERKSLTWLSFTDAGIDYAIALGVDLNWMKESK